MYVSVIAFARELGVTTLSGLPIEIVFSDIAFSSKAFVSGEDGGAGGGVDGSGGGAGASGASDGDSGSAGE